ncbi:hypothetical protein B5F88_04970 [Flavonifractor sp. An306]|nr:hypothetical protein B5F88_04970 [Flavonifractor sp. An306]
MEAVHRSGKPPKPMQAPSRPKDRQGASGRTAEIRQKLTDSDFGRLRPRLSASACVCPGAPRGKPSACRTSPHLKKVSRGGAQDRAGPRMRENLPHQGFDTRLCGEQEVRSMPTAPKVLDNMSKNLTEEERQLREQAEDGVIPDRGRDSRMEKPAIMTKNAAAGRYWRKVLERMDGLVILDDLDSDALGVYCVMLARYESQCKVLVQVTKQLKDAKDKPEAVADAVAKLDAVSGKMQSLERNILQYAEKLGLTPSGRVRLAQKRAQAASEAQADPDGDLYGD